MLTKTEKLNKEVRSNLRSLGIEYKTIVIWHEPKRPFANPRRSVRLRMPWGEEMTYTRARKLWTKEGKQGVGR